MFDPKKACFRIRGRALRGLLLACVVGCAHTGPSWDGLVLRVGKTAFRLGPVPTRWRALHSADSSVAYEDRQNRADILFNARCGREAEDVPLSVLRNHLLMGTTEREFGQEETIPFDGREALHTVLTAKLDGVPRSYDVFVLKKDGCVCDFVLVAPPESLTAATADFEGFVKGFHASTEGRP